MTSLSHIIARIVFCMAAIAMAVPQANALALTTYADTSALAQGRWVKISVPETGMYRISAATLRQWGFANPAAVRVHGYGATRIPDVLSAANYVDDLPVAPSENLADGSVVFFGVGPEGWSSPVYGRFVPERNIYTDYGYYFVSESGAPLPEMKPTGEPSAAIPSRTFNERLVHEIDAYTPGEAGPHLVGEDFKLTRTRQFNFKMPGRVPDTKVWMQTSFVTKTMHGESRLAYKANGETLPQVSGDVIGATVNNNHLHGVEAVSRRTFDMQGENLDLEIAFTCPTFVNGAWLNYLAINYTRALDLPADGSLVWYSSDIGQRLGNAPDNLRLWDVTSHTAPRTVNVSLADGFATWTAASAAVRRYAAWSPDAKLPEPRLAGAVANQNLHALQQADMLIVCPTQWMSQAQRIAKLHCDEGLSVIVVDPDQIYNEFASGAPDVSALRKFMKMLYDRGRADNRPLKFTLLMARATYDPRHLTYAMEGAAQTIPAWLGGTMRNSLNDEEGFGTDDFIAMLEDGTGANRGIDNISVAVGRIPSRSLAEATQYVDKLEQYVRKPKMSDWKNRIMIVADDEDQAVHMDQAEKLLSNLNDTNGHGYVVNKVYIDEFVKSGGVYPQARQQMFRMLDEGTAWWMFVGHANNHSMTHDGQLTYNDINNMFLKHVPILYAATCDFLRWDSNTLSGGEILFNERYGGTIATISATRPVYIYENGLLNNAFGRALGKRDSNGARLRLGEIYQQAKNDIRNKDGNRVSNVNRLRFVLMGDPAMRLPIADNIVTVDSIAGAPLSDNENQYPVMAARQNVSVTGRITNHNGETLQGFDGYVNATLYDAEYSVTTKGNGETGKALTFDRQGQRIFAGSAPVVNGHYNLRLVIPSEISNNMRPAALNLYAVSKAATIDADSTATGTTALNGHLEATGLEKRLFVAGFDETTPVDTIAPSIDSFFINHPDFYDGARVNAEPMAIANISDNYALNISSAGIGHNMIMVLDGNRVFNDVSQFFTPATDGSASGTINYPLPELTAGMHSLMLRIWDVDANASTKTITFNVDPAAAPKIFDVYSDANPATTSANFYITHNRPDCMATVTVTVYNLIGRPLWSKTVTGISDMFTSTPVSWNLTDFAGRRLGRGIYLYRATITCDGEHYDTGSHRIAVTN